MVLYKLTYNGKQPYTVNTVISIKQHIYYVVGTKYYFIQSFCFTLLSEEIFKHRQKESKFGGFYLFCSCD